ncbi:MAG TPA: hypothetical protein VFW80_09045 [Gaiellaceae bacterium]|nr:hypothetical protein [Gaiellaceae bacterium]
MSDPALVFTGEGRTGSRLVVNFGVFAGREATEAEIYRLAQALLEELDSVEIVAEQRYQVAADVEATVHQVYVEVPRSAEGREARLMSLVRAWAEDAIAERRRLAP